MELMKNNINAPVPTPRARRVLASASVVFP
jgi:hypothetical protein